MMQSDWSSQSVLLHALVCTAHFLSFSQLIHGDGFLINCPPYVYSRMLTAIAQPRENNGAAAAAAAPAC